MRLTLTRIVRVTQLHNQLSKRVESQTLTLRLGLQADSFPPKLYYEVIGRFSV